MARLRAIEQNNVDIHDDSSSDPRTRRSSTAATPPLSQSSDKENAQSARSKRAMPPPSRRAASEVDGTTNSAPKRQRVNGVSSARSTPNPDTIYFDPHQDIRERQTLRKDLREISKDAVEYRQEWLKADDSGLYNAVNRANTLFNSVKQTSDATIDSRFLTIAGELTLKKTQKMAMEEGAQGIDVDQFVSKCIAFMNAGNDGSRPTRGDDDEEDEEDVGDALNWEHLGAYACFPVNLRPPVPSFLLGPLSIQKRVRTIRARRERLQRNTNVEETRPDELKAADMQKDENTTLVAQCKKIHNKLRQVKREGKEAAHAEITDDTSDDQYAAILEKNNITDSGGVPLFRFALHPTSFGQSVENLFYISFLIRDNLVEMRLDEDDLPTLHWRRRPGEQPEDDDDQDGEETTDNRRKAGVRHQAVFSLDHGTWQELVKVFNIREPLIPDRSQEAASTQVGARGWYQ